MKAFVLVGALYYEVNASVFAACGKLNFLGRDCVHGRTVGHLFVACKELSSHIGLACIGCSCIDGHIVCITLSSLALGMMPTNIILMCNT